MYSEIKEQGRLTPPQEEECANDTEFFAAAKRLFTEGYGQEHLYDVALSKDGPSFEQELRADPSVAGVRIVLERQESQTFRHVFVMRKDEQGQLLPPKSEIMKVSV